MEVFAQEDAVENFLAGESKEFNDDLIPNVEEDVEFKRENVLELENNVLADCDLINGDNVKDGKNIIDYKRYRRNSLVNALKKRSIRCLNKMHVMEDVREGSDVPGAQPSSPGHAEQRPDVEEIPQAANENSMEAEEIPTQKTNGETEDPASEETNAEDKPENKDEIGSLPEETSNDSTNDESAKRKYDEDESTNKRLRSTIEQNYILREKIFSEYVDNGGFTTVAQIQMQVEQIVSEIRTLNEMAREKEKEWNNIVHLKKMKEELLLRVQRRKQVMILSNDKIDWNDIDSPESQPDLDKNAKNLVIYSSPGATKSSGDSSSSSKQKSKNLPNTVLEMNGHGDLKQNKQRNVLDVQSIIADYRQRHPEAVPRRGRRIRSILNNQGDSSSMVRTGNGSVMNFSSISLGSGSQVKQNLSASSVDANTELGLLLTAVDNGKSSGIKSLGNEDSASFKDVLMQFAKLSQTEKQDLLQTAMKPPPYSEVTVHPVPAHTQTSNSLLHGILTKTQTRSENNKSTFSPTLARLLTAPERAAISPHNNQNASVSITDMLSSNKARNEITITPVGGQFDLTVKEKQGDEEEAEDSADRLVIDESEALDGRKCTDNGSDAGDEVPQCQGCNQKPAQFVCAGCGNQWYCSRECQVVAWDEHSEVCSG